MKTKLSNEIQEFANAVTKGTFRGNFIKKKKDLIKKAKKLKLPEGDIELLEALSIS